MLKTDHQTNLPAKYFSKQPKGLQIFHASVWLFLQNTPKRVQTVGNYKQTGIISSLIDEIDQDILPFLAIYASRIKTERTRDPFSAF
jgi:hypothetical protein